MQARPYQADSIRFGYEALRRDPQARPLQVIPTGGGKTIILSTIARDVTTHWGGRCLILSHVKELVGQSAAEILEVDSTLDVGVYSAGLKRRETENAIITAGIQSVYKRAAELGPFNMVIVDEAHLIPPDGEGMYRTFLQDAAMVNPKFRLMGLTATPYRLSSGLIYGEGEIFTEIAYEVGVRELIADGYLSPLVSKRVTEFDDSGIRVTRGDYNASDMESSMLQTVSEAVRETIGRTKDRNSVLIFSAGVSHAVEICNFLQSAGETVALITGDTDPAERDETIVKFKAGEIKYLVNVNVLTTGFNAPNVDAVVLLRSTLSPGLYYQMVGRGFRLFPGKRNCLILDFGGNVMRHGPVDQVNIGHGKKRKGEAGEAPSKVCPQCQSENAAGRALCVDCGFAFPIQEKPKHEAEADDVAPLSGEITEDVFEVHDTEFYLHTKMGADETAPKTMRVDYMVSSGNSISEWICIEHDGFAGDKARKWWAERSRLPMPHTAADAVNIARLGGLSVTREITRRKVSGERFSSLVDYVLDERPEVGEAGADPLEEFEENRGLKQLALIDPDDVPF
ncbi:DEAD/DEAH box helicase [Thalassoglobus polymorphus]|uniref:Type I restriction enzyme EcoKI subunit R n=1 Tax=Thalassoglobus polymorphus TaxID=2527994 RepID=A0A517QGZ1_9PLAN|nr:DEAD/DEAH box helicase [Thalassoglobus polymorphus]QDT30906.1 type I restriction enzyme EcoKI subunit R [Thalassoglobus polymorphus]QDT30951.1 type I restriction enzyme EcoKI subunit R [Thalassoglobus polymorphus]